jgi:hypothetical protein
VLLCPVSPLAAMAHDDKPRAGTSHDRRERRASAPSKSDGVVGAGHGRAPARRGCARRPDPPRSARRYSGHRACTRGPERRGPRLPHRGGAGPADPASRSLRRESQHIGIAQTVRPGRPPFSWEVDRCRGARVPELLRMVTGEASSRPADVPSGGKGERHRFARHGGNSVHSTSRVTYVRERGWVGLERLGAGVRAAAHRRNAAERHKEGRLASSSN